VKKISFTNFNIFCDNVLLLLVSVFISSTLVWSALVLTGTSRLVVFNPNNLSCSAVDNQLQVEIV